MLESFRSRHSNIRLAYTYFSPSAESFAASLTVDFRDVLPFDTRRAARAVLEALRPAALVFSKLDVWPNLCEECKRRGIPVALISATLAPGSSRSGALAGLVLRDAYAMIDAVGAISPEDAARLIELGCRPEVVRITGDTRFDQVITRARGVDHAGVLFTPLRSDRPTLVAGSTWPADERELFTALGGAPLRAAGLRTIIAPHEPTAAHVATIERGAAAAGLRSATLGKDGAATADVIIVDRLGVLGDLYAIADIAFVGGGFHSAGLHSVLEPAAYGVPVLFGPSHHDSRDARLLLAAGAARSSQSGDDMSAALLAWIHDPIARRRAGDAARNVVEANSGATIRSVELIEQLLASVLP